MAETKNNESAFEYRDAPKRPKILDGELFNFKLRDTYYTVYVGLLDSKPYEVFIEVGGAMSINYDNGYIEKQSKGKYIYISNTLVDTDDGKAARRYIMFNPTDEQEAITRLISAGLRHGTDIKFIVEQLSKIDGELFSFVKGLSRILKKYIPNGSKSTTSCHDCGGHNVVFEEGCMSCKDCGSSKCG